MVDEEEERRQEEEAQGTHRRTEAVSPSLPHPYPYAVVASPPPPPPPPPAEDDDGLIFEKRGAPAETRSTRRR